MIWRSALPGIERFVLFALNKFADGSAEPSVYPQQKTLSELTGFSRKTITRTIDKLRLRGFIATKVRKRANGSTVSLIYTLKWSRIAPDLSDSLALHRDTETIGQNVTETDTEWSQSPLVEQYH